MKRLHLLFVILLAGFSGELLEQAYASDKGSAILFGSAHFVSQGGDRYEWVDGERSSVLVLSPGFDFFMFKNVFLGGELNFSATYLGDSHSSSIGIGPRIGYAYGREHSVIIPYAQVGFLYMTSSYNGSWGESSETNFLGGVGLIVPVKKHIGLMLEGRYDLTRNVETERTGNIFSINIGIAGLIF